MEYILDSHNESKRLEIQNALPQYSIEEELKHLKIDLNGKKILDAGCGIGSLSTILGKSTTSDIFGCDASELRIHQAKKSTAHKENFFVADLASLPCKDETFDIIFVRFVLEHTLDPSTILRELYRVLKSGGHLVIIDFDGLIFNLHHQNSVLENYLSLLQKDLPIDLFIGRKLVRMVYDMGMTLSDCSIQPLFFHGPELEKEVENMLMRFSQTAPYIKKILGEEYHEDFISQYISEMRISQALFCNKFIVSARKKNGRDYV
jgi:ubiquinone/menaquinone biosynthesis C-methylase UbiE